MFDSLTARLGATFGRLRGKGRLSEADVSSALGEVRLALLEADVNVGVVKEFLDRVRVRAVGAEVRSLHMQGPTGAGGGINFGAKQILAVKSVLIPREWVKPEIIMEQAA